MNWLDSLSLPLRKSDSRFLLCNLWWYYQIGRVNWPGRFILLLFLSSLPGLLLMNLGKWIGWMRRGSWSSTVTWSWKISWWTWIHSVWSHCWAASPDENERKEEETKKRKPNQPDTPFLCLHCQRERTTLLRGILLFFLSGWGLD